MQTYTLCYFKILLCIGGLISSCVKAAMLVDNFKVSMHTRAKNFILFSFVIRYFAPAGDNVGNHHVLHGTICVPFREINYLVRK